MSVCGSVRGLEAWDPRKDAHSNSKFNSYPNGIGRDLQAQHRQQNGVVSNGDGRHVQIMRRDPAEKRPTKLYVTGAPRRCTTTSLEDMFNKYGEVLEVSRGSDPNNHQLSRLWVTYGSFREANAAIQSLDGVRIDEVHQLKVCVALSEEEIARRKQARIEEENHLAAITQHSVMNSSGAVSPKPRSLRSCVSCGQSADQQCGSCKEPYCSRDCQTQDWVNHRHVCAKKKLDVVKDLRAPASSSLHIEIRNLKLDVPLSLSVFDATDPGDFAVLDSVEGDLRYVTMESALADLTPQIRKSPSMRASIQETDDDPCSLGTGVLAFFEEQFSRAIVIREASRTPDGNPLLWFVDYGNTASTPFDDIRPLTPEFAELPSRVVPCALANLKPKNGALVWPTDVQLMLKQLLLKDLKIIVREIPNDFFPRHKVDVLSGDDDLATVLVQAGYADWIRPPENTASKLAPAAMPTPAAVSTPPLHLPGTSETVKVGDVFDGTIVYHTQPGKFFVWKVDDAVIGQFTGVSEELNRHFAGSKPDPNFSPAPGDYVGAWVVADEQWCRACVLASIDDSGLIRIRYLDYGEEASLNPAQLRPLTAALLGLKVPAMAISCETASKLFPEAADAWKPESTALVEEQFPVFGSVKVEVVDKDGGGTLFVVAKREDGVSMTDLLVSSGHATKAPSEAPVAFLPTPPQQVVMASSVPAYPVENLRERERFPAMVPHCIDWQNLFVQPFTEENQLHMIKLSDEITRALQGRSGGIVAPRVGQLVLAKDVDDGYYRAEVVSVDASTSAVSVKFLDYGNRNVASMSDCLPPTPELVDHHVLGFWAGFDESLPPSTNGVVYELGGPVDPDAIATLTSLPQIDIRLSAAGTIADVQTPEKQDVLKILGLPVKPPPSNLRAVDLPSCPFGPPSDPSTPPLSILITDVQSLQRIYVQCLTSEMALANEALTMVMSLPMDPVVGEIAVGDLLAVPFSDGCLYRAEVIDVQENDYLAVHFVDYGNCYVAPRSSALTLPDNSMGIPPLVLPVSLNDEAYVTPTGFLDASTVALLTVETPTYNITFPTVDSAPSKPLPPSKRPSISAVIKDSAKTLNVLDIFAAAGVVKLRPVQSPSPPAVKLNSIAAASPISDSALEVKFRADTVPPCPFVPEVGEAKKIIVTEVMSLSQIYVQVVVPEFLDALSAVETSILEIDTKQPTNVQVGDLVLALFEDGAFYRAEVLEVSGADIKVSFIDYGNLVTVSQSNLRRPSEKLTQYPRLCFSVKVSSSNKYSANVCDLDDSILSWLKNPAPSFDLSIINPKSQSSRNSPLSGKITDVSGTSIVDCLGDAGYLKVKTSSSDTSLANPQPNDQSPVSNQSKSVNAGAELPNSRKPTLAELPFPSPGEFILTHFNSAADFFLQNEDCVVAAVQLQTTVDAHVATSKSFAETGGKPAIGSLVLSQYEGVFYRALVSNVGEIDVLLHFVDYGNDAHAPTSAIYPASEEIRKVPKLCFRCTAAEGELNNLSSDDEAALRSFLPDGCFFNLEEVCLLPDQRHHISPVEGKEQFIAIAKKYLKGSSAATPESPVSTPVIVCPISSEAPTAQDTTSRIPVDDSVPLPNPLLSDMKQGHVHLVEGAAVGCDINEFVSPVEMHLALKEETSDMLALAQDLAAYGPTAPPLLSAVSSTNLSAGSVVVALWCEGWYRAALLNDVIDLKPDTVVEVRFIDYGNCDQVALKDVRQILTKHFDVPIQSLRCRLSGICLPKGTTEWLSDVQTLLQEWMTSGAVSTCRVRKFNTDTKVFLIILLFNDVPMQKTLVEKGLASKTTGNTPASLAKSPTVPPAVDSSPSSPALTAASSIPPVEPAAAPSPSPVVVPTPVADPIPEIPPSRSVSVIPKNAEPEAAPKAPAMMVPRSLKTPPPTTATLSSPRPEKTIAITSLQIGSESRNVVMFVAGVHDIAILMCATTDLAGYSGIEETILASTNDLIVKKGKFDDPKRQLQRGAAVLALYEGQLYRAVITAAFEDEEPDKIRVWFVDYGNSASLTQSDLVEISPDLVKLPALCAPCGLRGVLRPRPGAIHYLNDLVNAEVVVQCHEIDSRGAIPKMIVSLHVEGVDVAVKLRNEGLWELDGDDENEAVPVDIGAVVADSTAITVDINNNADVAPVDIPRAVDINNNLIEEPTVQEISVPAAPISALASSPPEPMDSDTPALREDNEKLKKQIVELTEKISELTKKHEEEMKKMEKKIDTLKSLI